ncbi:MAG: DsrE family protein [Kangiellaceae bacterium]|jgi:intracellular sulfur oxidation DsrE/DsrF family protein|nr:DsrE family protein [Kangiellaceae bacterium]
MKLVLLLSSVIFATTTTAAEKFTKGPLITGYGINTKVEQTNPVSKNQVFKVAFDIAKHGPDDKVNNKINSLARFLNMHVRAGIPAKNIQLALVVHGEAGFDIMHNKAYQEKFLTDNPNLELLQKLMANGVRVIQCGQSAAFHGIKNADMMEGAEMALSAMTAHALLQQQGYTLNPF